jgi:hypothetical protein
MKKLLFLVILAILFVSCESEHQNEFVVKKIETYSSGAKYTLKRESFDGSTVYIRDFSGKFSVGDTLIMVKKSKIKNDNPDTIPVSDNTIVNKHIK